MWKSSWIRFITIFLILFLKMTIPNNREATDIGYALRQSQERVQNALYNI